MVKVERFAVFLVALDPTRGKEIHKTRPCAILSPQDINKGDWPILVAPLTSNFRPFPFHIKTAFGDKKGSILLDQMRFVDRGRIIKHLGCLDPKEGYAALSCLRDMFEE